MIAGLQLKFLLALPGLQLGAKKTLRSDCNWFLPTGKSCPKNIVRGCSISNRGHLAKRAGLLNSYQFVVAAHAEGQATFPSFPAGYSLNS
jgi:hypothetical protein